MHKQLAATKMVMPTKKKQRSLTFVIYGLSLVLQQKVLKVFRYSKQSRSKSLLLKVKSKLAFVVASLDPPSQHVTCPHVALK